jgi:hypothetical protein
LIGRWFLLRARLFQFGHANLTLPQINLLFTNL